MKDIVKGTPESIVKGINEGFPGEISKETPEVISDKIQRSISYLEETQEKFRKVIWLIFTK